MGRVELMPTRRAGTPCTGCGKPAWKSRDTLPAGQYRCHECRRAAFNRTCKQCGQAFTMRYNRGRGQSYCSKSCSSRATGQARKRTPPGWQWRAHATRRKLPYLIERDRGRCQATVCHFRSRKVATLGTRGPRQPSCDHIVPLSQGGTDTLDNVHLTHYRCNLSRGNRGGGEQLRLVG